MNTDLYERALSRGFLALKKMQLRSGGFESITFGKDCEEIIRHTAFYPGLIALALSASNDKRKDSILRKCGGFLRMQKSAAWTFNYWNRTLKDSTMGNYPDDLDDTSVCLSALFKINKNAVTEKTLASFVNILIALEEKPGGPYNTWILGDYRGTHWHDIDIAVNANIGGFLHSQNITLDGLNEYLEEEIKNNRFNSKYYHKKVSVIYFLSKWYLGKYAQKLLGILEKGILKEYKDADALDLAQAISSWIRLGGDVNSIKKQLIHLLKIQNQDGTWSWSDFFIEEVKSDQNLYSGCAAFSSACAIEAMSLYQNALAEIPLERERVRKQSLTESVHDAARKRFSDSPKPIRAQLDLFIFKLSASDIHREISLLPFFAWDSLNSRQKSRIKKTEILNLCEANLLGWIAYTVYDAVIDGETKEQFLPLANICIREVIFIYQEFFDKKGFQSVTRILNAIDHANLWEKMNCRFEIKESHFEIPELLPDYKRLGHLANKSLGHALGPIAIMLKFGKKKSAEQIEGFFLEYLIARQMNDDAHDWTSDLREGFVNPAGAILLSEFRKKFPKRKILDLAENSTDVADLQKAFWDSTIERTSAEILRHTKRARAILKKIPIFSNTNYLETLLASLNSSANKAITERNKTKEFLEAYK
ncbi:MAG: hypothetical protein JWM20_425 [Patescibacteria group bacterium]|nr:hypothetical protein [Patescibacteria group bacterium]